jgi:hypothetical protein
MRLDVDAAGGGEEEEDIPVAVAVRVAPPPPSHPNALSPTCVFVNPVTNQLHLGNSNGLIGRDLGCYRYFRIWTLRSCSVFLDI